MINETSSHVDNPVRCLDVLDTLQLSSDDRTTYVLLERSRWPTDASYEYRRLSTQIYRVILLINLHKSVDTQATVSPSRAVKYYTVNTVHCNVLYSQHTQTTIDERYAPVNG